MELWPPGITVETTKRPLTISRRKTEYAVRGPPLDIWGGGLTFLPGYFYLFHKGDGKFYFSSQDRLYFHQALWPFIYLTHVSHKIIFWPFGTDLYTIGSGLCRRCHQTRHPDNIPLSVVTSSNQGLNLFASSNSTPPPPPDMRHTDRPFLLQTWAKSAQFCKRWQCAVCMPFGHCFDPAVPLDFSLTMAMYSRGKQKKTTLPGTVIWLWVFLCLLPCAHLTER